MAEKLHLVDVLIVTSPRAHFIPGLLTQEDVAKINKARGFHRLKESSFYSHTFG